MQAYFRTSVPAGRKLTIKQFLDEVSEWVEKDFNIDPSGIQEIDPDRWGIHHMTTESNEEWFDVLLHEDIVGVNLRHPLDNLIVHHKALLNAKKNIISFESFAEMKEDSISLPDEVPQNTLLSQIQSKRLLGKNGKFSISKWPMKLREDDAEIITDLLTGKSNITLPVILVMDPDYNAEMLVEQFAGMASVIVNDDPGLFEIIAESNPKMTLPADESITIYFPGKSLKPIIVNPDRDVLTESKAVLDSYLLHRPYDDDVLYDSVVFAKNEESYKAAMIQMNDVQNEYEQFRMMTDEKLTKKNMHILNQMAKQTTPKPKPQNGCYINKGSEEPLYENEIEEIIWDILVEYRRKNAADGSRRAAILDDLIKENNGEEFRKSLRSKHKEIKDILQDYSVVTPQMKRRLEDLGFKVKTGNGHGKLVWYGDPRYVSTIASTASDHRAGANLASDIIKSVM